MITTLEVHTSLLSLVPIHTLFIIQEFGSGKYSNASMYVCVCTLSLKASSMCDNVWDILEGTDQRSYILSFI